MTPRPAPRPAAVLPASATIQRQFSGDVRSRAFGYLVNLFIGVIEIPVAIKAPRRTGDPGVRQPEG
jgi:hypothetical protein